MDSSPDTTVEEDGTLWPDRLVEFARDEEHHLLDECEEVRQSALNGDFAGAEVRLHLLQEHLAQHLAWEETSLLAAYRHRCRPGDAAALLAHNDCHDAILDRADELAGHLARAVVSAPDVRVRELVEHLTALLADHQELEVNDVCAALDRALDALRIHEIARDLALLRTVPMTCSGSMR